MPKLRCQCPNRASDLHRHGCRWAGIEAVDVLTSANVRRVAKLPMVMRSIRVPAALWEAAKTKADERGESISDVVRDALEAYLRRK